MKNTIEIKRSVHAPFWEGGTAPFGVAVNGHVIWLRESVREAWEVAWHQARYSRRHDIHASEPGGLNPIRQTDGPEPAPIIIR
jgi:hypothetical protein